MKLVCRDYMRPGMFIIPICPIVYLSHYVDNVISSDEVAKEFKEKLAKQNSVERLIDSYWRNKLIAYSKQKGYYDKLFS